MKGGRRWLPFYYGRKWPHKTKEGETPGPPSVTGFASFRNTITEFNVAKLAEKVDTLILFFIRICSGTRKIPLKY